ncbi:MAG TPA: hypothetical protein VIW22_00055 [Nitrososphaerales archaeon]
MVSDEKIPPKSVKIGRVFMDLIFTTEKEVLNPANPEHVLTLAAAKPIRDTSLVLSTSTAANSAVLTESARKASGVRLSSAVKILGRVDEALTKKAVRDADFWLLAASYEFGYAWLLSKEVLPSPSHLLSQMREASRGSPTYFEAFSAGVGLEAAGRAGCGARLEGVSVLHDILRGRSQGAQQVWPPARTEILAAKADALISNAELAECYSFLGQDVVDDVLALMKGPPRSSFPDVTSGSNRLLGERLVRQLGLARHEPAVRAGFERVRKQVSALAKGV